MGSYDEMRERLGVDALLTRRRATFRDRIDCWRDTVSRVEAAGAELLPPPSVKTRFDPSLAPCRDRHGVGTTRVTVEDADTIDCGLAYLAAGHRPAVLNLADHLMPGGCVDIGSGAQEESLFRRTALCATLLHSRALYPIADDEGIYSADVPVIKAAEADGWELHDERLGPPPRMCFLTVPGVPYPACTYATAEDRKPRLRGDDEARLVRKVRTMLQLAQVHGHDVVVLGASGCGAWKCPPDHVAEVFDRVVREYDGAFHAVAFAILKDADDNAPAKRAMGIRDNHEVFSERLLGRRSSV